MLTTPFAVQTASKVGLCPTSARSNFFLEKNWPHRI